MPGDWCPLYSQNQKCSIADIVTPIVLVGWALEAIQKVLEQEVGSGDIDRLMKWMGRPSGVGGVRAPNSVWAAELIIRSIEAQRKSERTESRKV